MKRILALWFALIACPLWGQSVKLPDEVKGDPGAWVVVVPTSKDGGDVKWKIGPGLTRVPIEQLFPGQKPAGVVVQARKAGTYEVWAWNAKGDVASDLAVCKVTIGDVPPDPGPGPGPGPDPGPTPGPAPIPVAGFRVLMLYEEEDKAKYPASQLSVLTGRAVRDYLESKCVVGPDSKTREYRIWDKDVDASPESKHWQDALKRPRTALPWVIISDGKTGFEGPLPQTIEETLTLLKKYGG